MSKLNLYIDGCSMIYGQGLPREKSIGHLFKSSENYNIVCDNSRPGKSNNAIFYDTMKNRNNYDIFILGFTYSNRTYLKFRDHNIDLHIGKETFVDYQHYWDENLEKIYSDLHKVYYSVYDDVFNHEMNNFLIESLINTLENENKLVIPFSWEKRDTQKKIFYPMYRSSSWISPNDPHLNENATLDLYSKLSQILCKDIN
jgi:hypothetical protein